MARQEPRNPENPPLSRKTLFVQAPVTVPRYQSKQTMRGMNAQLIFFDQEIMQTKRLSILHIYTYVPQRPLPTMSGIKNAFPIPILFSAGILLSRGFTLELQPKESRCRNRKRHGRASFLRTPYRVRYRASQQDRHIL